MKNLFVSSIIGLSILLTYSLEVNANAMCIGVYQAIATEAFVPISSSSATTNTRIALKVSKMEVSEVIEKYDSIVSRTPEELQQSQNEIAARMEKDILQLERQLSKEQIQNLIKKILSSGFFMSRFHEDIVRQTLNIHSSAQFEQMKLVFSSERPADAAEQAAKVNQVLNRIKAIYNDENSFQSATFQNQILRAAIIKSKQFPNVLISDKKLAIMLEKLEELLDTPGGEKVLEISIRNSMKDTIVIAQRRNIGAPTKILNTVTGYLAAFAPIWAPIAGSLVAGNYFHGDAALSGMLVGMIGGMGVFVTGGSEKIYKYFESEKSPFKRLVGVPKEATVNWRRWKQRFSNRDKVTQELVDQQKELEQEQKPKQLVVEDSDPLEQIKSELAGRITEPVQITNWGKGIDRLMEYSIERLSTLAEKQVATEKEIISITEEINQTAVASTQRPALNHRHQLAKQKMTSLILEWTELSNSLLTIAHIIDQYKERGEWEKTNSPIPVAYKKFLDGRVQLLIVSERNLLDLAIYTGNSIERAYSFLLTEDTRVAVGKIDRSLDITHKASGQ